MFVSHTREEQLFESFTEIVVIIAYLHEVVLNDVGHDIFVYLFDFLPL